MSIRIRMLPLAALGFAFAGGQALAADAQEAIFAAYQKMMGSKFAADMTTVSGDRTTKAHSEYDTVDRIHLKTDQMEMIVLPEGTWMRTGGEWTKPPVDMSGMVKQFVPKSIEDMRASIKSAADNGMTTFNGAPAHAYAYDVDTTVMGIHVTSKNKILVDPSGRIVHSESEGEAMGQKSRTIQDIRYDDGIRVVAP